MTKLLCSNSARAHNIDQYICNEQDFGLMLHFKGEEVAKITPEDEKKALEDFLRNCKRAAMLRLQAPKQQVQAPKEQVVPEQKVIATVNELKSAR